MNVNTYFLILLAALIAVNGVSFFLYRGDKLRARRNEWRASEMGLLVWALIGPYGAYLAMQRYRHKTKHAKFLLVPIFLVLETGLIVFLFLRYMTIA
jgi:uncharacterized membrane protein YsdA (DUF1294 family)